MTKEGWGEVRHKILCLRKYKNNKVKKVKGYGKDCWRVGGGSGLVENMTIDRDGDCYLIAKAPAFSSVPLQELNLSFQDLGDLYQVENFRRILQRLIRVEKLWLVDNSLTDLSAIRLPR
ncbi:hypothetical protein CIB84_013986 [Bambusicola thoracicus]|uniref:U2A'/phosphoprotein 32 family A C-terminal domain-containing protein n=1 Tax=Bambusicola thoracicus TaxID=9083 RepID=A0A2P4SDU0_BAMTH|nr:hypothetical protein CIB84_013986 [Bambusicola thoracicus]